MRASTVVQQLCKSCRTCFMFYCTFYFTCDRSLRQRHGTDSGCTDISLGCSRRACYSCASSRDPWRRCSWIVRRTSWTVWRRVPTSPAPRSRPPCTDSHAAVADALPRRDDRRRRCCAVKTGRPGTPRQPTASRGRNRLRGRGAIRPASCDIVPQRVYLKV